MERQSRIGAVYIRVSTNGQMELSPESQLREVLHYAESREIDIPASFVFMEKEGHSGKRAENRPEFQRMIATAKLRPRPFDVILVWKFSRFARNQDESTFYKGMLRKKLGIDVISVSEPVIDGMYGRLIELIIEWQDEFYSYNLSTEVRRGMAEHARQGGYQAPAPYGYKHEGPGSTPSLVPHEADVVRRIFSQYTELGYSPSAIAAELNENGITTKRGNPFDRRAVLYILQNPFYTGKIRWNPGGRSHKKGAAPGCEESEQDSVILSNGRHQAIITEEQFRVAGDRLTREQGKPEGTTRKRSDRLHKHCLCGILRCPVCGAALSYHTSQSPVFQCWRYARGLHKGSASISERRAMAGLLASLEELEQAASPIMKRRTWQPVPGKKEEEHRKKFARSMRALSQKEQRILAAYENGVDSLEEYQAKKERLAGDRRTLLEKESGAGERFHSAEEDSAPFSSPDSLSFAASAAPAVSGLPPVDSLSSLIRCAEIPTEIKSRALQSILTAAVYDRGRNCFYFYYRSTAE